MLSDDDVEAVAAAFALGPSPRLGGRTARGEQGVVVEVVTDAGVWAVKELSRREPDGELEAQAAFAGAARGAGVATPRTVRAGDGRLLAAVGTAFVRVYEWVDLALVDPLLPTGDVAATVAALHRVGAPSGDAVDPWYWQRVGAPAWTSLLDELSTAGAPFAAPLAERFDDLVALEGFLAPPRPLRTCHRDLWADNVRRGADGALWVIDWDNAGPDDPSRELALVLYEYGAGDTGRAASIQAAYAEAGGPGRVTREADFTTVIAQLGHINETACRRWLAAGDDDAGAEVRRRAESLVQEFLDRPLTVAGVRAILQAVSVS